LRDSQQQKQNPQATYTPSINIYTNIFIYSIAIHISSTEKKLVRQKQNKKKAQVIFA